MAWWLMLSLAVMAASLGVVAVVAWRSVPRVRVLDVESIPQEKTRQIKDKLIVQRFERLAAERFGVVGKTATAGVKAASKAGRRAVQRLYRLEQYYQKMRKAPAKASESADPEAIKRLLSEAAELVHAEEFIPAEKKYIEVISHDSKNVDAYEGLGALYIRSRQYPQARETLQFALRISPDDASVRMALADLEMKQDHPQAALEQLRAAVAKRPGNPKYLDAYIEAALAAKEASDARKGIALLREANPENQKLEEFEESLREIAPKEGPASEASQTA